MPHWTDADPTRTFADRATLYERGRPAYPEAAIDFLLEGLGDPASVRVADVGAGTAHLARLFVTRGCRVVAVEPNAEMRAAAPAVEGLDWCPATAEDTGLPDASFELLTVAQALHWVDPDRALPEFVRLLVPRGRLAVIWNDRFVKTAFEREYQDLLRELKPPERRDHPPKDSTPALSGTSWFEEPELHLFEHDHLMDAGTLVARTQSLSYAPAGRVERAALERRLNELHARHADGDGSVIQRYTMRVHLSRARA